MAGRWDEVGGQAEAALALGARAGDPNAPLLVRVQREVVREIRHEPLDVAWFVDMAERSPVPGAYLGSLAIIDAARGRHERAREAVSRLVEGERALLPSNANWLALCELAEAAAETGHEAARGGRLPAARAPRRPHRRHRPGPRVLIPSPTSSWGGRPPRWAGWTRPRPGCAARSRPARPRARTGARP